MDFIALKQKQLASRLILPPVPPEGLTGQMASNTD